MNAKVIATSFLGKRTSRTRVDFPQHPQDITNEKQILKMLDDVLSYECEVEAGVAVDTIVVINGRSPFNAELNEWKGRKTKNGKILVMERENVGGSFGAYNFAFSKLKNHYDHWLFTEDDIVVGTNNYYQRLLDFFNKEKLGFAALISVTNHPLGEHAHGGVGLTSTKILREVFPSGLPHYKEPGWDKTQIIHDGEIPFTNQIVAHGYEIREFNWHPTWDFETKLCTPYLDFKNEIRKS